MAAITLMELKYDNKLCAVELAKRDDIGRIISSTYALKSEVYDVEIMSQPQIDTIFNNANSAT